ncbi:MAG: hypothetical protein M1493_03690 [Firmicutes bacterium]|nr:hypothetical protein [Bacillota bacterium]
MSKWWEESGTVQLNELIDKDVYRMVVYSPRVAKHAVAGQFLMIRPPNCGPLLPRAMAPIGFDESMGLIDIYYRVVGPGTQSLRCLTVNEAVTVIGPLGTAFTDFGRTMAIIGRGVGITPLLPIAAAAYNAGATIRSYLSARSRPLVLGLADFGTLGQTFTQDDESDPGELITNALAAHLQSGYTPDVVVVSGSHRLTAVTVQLGHEYGFTVWVFVEEKMACGVGYCKGCAIGPHRMLICTDGPALLSQEVSLRE